ncbi:KUP/HAK/KT family potassium transporter [uncultured Acetobacteroides sp.]|uniref:KUP/HAK/KT family potassium transporter n=1 Tax=uncultured Acetobacteroides sp. TaxID=1760811 RepID=UPI0029F4C68F|nr:KUP/HAK/KT family potassium transporter [uncultured Acetobacteroides sp.]
MDLHKKHGIKLSLSGLIITLGIVYGDIGTSPLYTFKAITGGLSVLKPEYIYGAVSLVIWTLTILTTIKYVTFTLKADNKGEGGIFSLFALIRRRVPKAYLLAIIGGSALLADGIITPAITVTTAVEGLKVVDPVLPVIPIVIGIITVLFMMQQFGTKILGRSFGPIMLGWFLMLAILGGIQVMHHPAIIKSLNPYYGYVLLRDYPGAIILMGAVFLATTGAEALYSDMGHVGAKNIRYSWIFVKVTLILNYMGQGAWVLEHPDTFKSVPSIFYSLMPSWFIIPGIIISTAAAVIASQALISGSFTLISEATSLRFWPRQRLRYPSDIKGQVYVPSINWMLWAFCLFVVIYFKSSTNMEAMYGLAITITMLSTTFLMSMWLRIKKVNPAFILIFMAVFLTIEGTFFVANVTKFVHGGWFSVLMALIFITVMYVWFNGRKIKNSFLMFVKIKPYISLLHDISLDKTIPKYATHLVYITRANNVDEIESKIAYSIVNKQPKRADVYWFLHVDILDEPDTFEYKVTTFDQGKIYKVDLRLGFKVKPKVEIYFRQVIDDMVKNNEVDIISRYQSLRNHDIMGDFKYVFIDRVVNNDHDFTPHQKFVMQIYNMVRVMSIPDWKGLGMDTSNVYVDRIPLNVDLKYSRMMRRCGTEDRTRDAER